MVEKDEASIIFQRGLGPKKGKDTFLLSDWNLGFLGASASRWTKAHDLLCQQKIQKAQIAQVVKESNAMLR